MKNYLFFIQHLFYLCQINYIFFGIHLFDSRIYAKFTDFHRHWWKSTTWLWQKQETVGYWVVIWIILHLGLA